MLHEEVNRESMQLAAKVGQVTYEEIRKALEKLIVELKTATNFPAASGAGKRGFGQGAEYAGL